MRNRTKLVQRIEALSGKVSVPLDMEAAHENAAMWRAEGLSELEIGGRQLERYGPAWINGGIASLTKYSLAVEDTIYVDGVSPVARDAFSVATAHLASGVLGVRTHPDDSARREIRCPDWFDLRDTTSLVLLGLGLAAESCELWRAYWSLPLEDRKWCSTFRYYVATAKVHAEKLSDRFDDRIQSGLDEYRNELFAHHGVGNPNPIPVHDPRGDGRE